MSRSFLAVAALAAAASGVPVAAAAQPFASEHASVSQTVDGTTITIEYSRPRIRGRGAPFGGIVHLGDHRWTPGANWATTITSDRPYRIGGHDVPAGTWSLWIDLEEDGWTLVMDPTDSLFHTAPPADSDEQIRFPVEPGEGPYVEALLWWVPETRIDGFDLLLSWGTTQVAFDVEVESSYVIAIPETEGRALEGSYEWVWVGGDEASAPAEPPAPMPFELTWHDERVDVRSVWEGESEPLFGMLVPRGAGWYQLGWGEDGELWEVMTWMTMEEVRGPDEHVLGFDIRAEDDTLMARVRRVATQD